MSLKILLLTLLWFAFSGLFGGIVADDKIILKTPPSSLEQWYKPKNKRQVWLHTMFRLRRELLAINDYSQEKQPELLDKWLKGFQKDYLAIADMVPEWKEFLDKDGLAKLQLAVQEKQFQTVPTIIASLQKSCENCHADYQAISRLMYRSPDFARIKVKQADSGNNLAYDKVMENLSNVVNRIKIAMHDHAYDKAIEFLKPLKSQLNNLSDGCQDCHKQAQEQVDYIINASQPILTQLEQALQNKDNKQARISLGTFAVKTCARCHSVHRTTAELKELME